MSYEERDNGTHAIVCDTDGCHIELLAPTKDDVFGDANLAGWISPGKDDNDTEMHICGHCARGTHPGSAILKRMMGGDTLEVEAPCGVSKGDEVRDDDGNLIGHYQADAQQGEQVDVKVQFPEPEKPTSASAGFAEMMEGADDDDDASGLRSVVAPDGGTGVPVPAPPVAPPPKPRSFAAAPGSDGGEGIVKPAAAPDATSPAARAAIAGTPTKPRGPSINQSAIDDATAAFDGIGSWDPDDDDD